MVCSDLMLFVVSLKIYLFAFKGRYFDLNEFSHAKQLADDKVFEFEENFVKLDRKECADLLDYQLAVTIYTAIDESDITEVFDRINAGGKHLSNREKTSRSNDILRRSGSYNCYEVAGG